MLQSRAPLQTDLAYLGHVAGLPVIPRLLVRLAASAARCTERARTRRALRGLDAHLLRDVGLSAYSAQREANKRFWQS